MKDSQFWRDSSLVKHYIRGSKDEREHNERDEEEAQVAKRTPKGPVCRRI